MKNKILIILALIIVTLFSACSKTELTSSESGNDAGSKAESKKEYPFEIIESKDIIEAEIILENGKTIKLDLYPEIAPVTVSNFVYLSNEKFYDGLIFHRVIKDFMVQGGCPNGMGTGGPGHRIEGEFNLNGFNNDLEHTRGVISMARSSHYDSAGSQFFIMHKDAPHLDGQYAAFGRVTDGMDVVDEIVVCETDGNDKPLTDIRIKTIIIK